MNKQATADELDRRVDLLLRGRRADQSAECDPLIAIASELRELPSPKFRQQLKAGLMEEAVPVGSSGGFEQAQGPVALGEIAPLLRTRQLSVFPADHRSFLVSFLSHAALIALIASGIFVSRGVILKPASETSELTYPLAGRGGGGSGDHSSIQATKGTPPKFSDQQLAPPAIVVRNPDPKLQVESSIVAPPDVKLPQSSHIGDLISSNIVIPSNGSGKGGGGGDGSGTGFDNGRGIGLGPGSPSGYGGDAFRPGRGVTAPRAIYDPEPEYSEEARLVKHQGTVVLALIVDQQGHARDVHVARSLGMGLDEKAIEAVRKWRFAPGTKDGSPVAVQVNVEVNFRLY